MCDYVPYYSRKTPKCLSACMSVCLSVRPSVRLSIRLDKIYLTLFKTKHGLVSFELGELKLSDRVMLCILDMVIVKACHT